jgi:hypothetical protein
MLSVRSLVNTMRDMTYHKFAEKIQEAWPFWDDLHSFWKELPNYRPIGVSNSAGGQDHAAQATRLFTGKKSKQDEFENTDDKKGSGIERDVGESSGESDTVVLNDEDDELVIEKGGEAAKKTDEHGEDSQVHVTCLP